MTSRWQSQRLNMKQADKSCGEKRAGLNIAEGSEIKIIAERLGLAT